VSCEAPLIGPGNGARMTKGAPPSDDAPVMYAVVDYDFTRPTEVRISFVRAISSASCLAKASPET
jgi:hypothetical protein